MPREFVRTDENPYRGVSWNVRDGYYRMKINFGRQQLTWNGKFQDPTIPARIYDQAAMLLRGPDANLNVVEFPDQFDGTAHPDFPRALVKAWLLSRGVPVGQLSEIGVAKIS